MDDPNTQKGTKEGFQGALDLFILFDAFVKNKCLFKNMLYNKSFLGLCQCSFSGNCEVSKEASLPGRTVGEFREFYE